MNFQIVGRERFDHARRVGTKTTEYQELSAAIEKLGKDDVLFIPCRNEEHPVVARNRIGVALGARNGGLKGKWKGKLHLAIDLQNKGTLIMRR